MRKFARAIEAETEAVAGLMVTSAESLTFSLETGECLSGEDYRVSVFPVRIDGDDVYVQLPPVEELDAELATSKACNKAHACELQPV